MAYTVVGMFPTNEAADKASHKLAEAGFLQEDYKVSRYSTADDYDAARGHNLQEDKSTHDFWNWLFDEDQDTRSRYSDAGSRNNLVTVYTDDFERAEKARDLMNEAGAINVNDLTKDRTGTSKEITAEEKARIIAKAKNNLYLTSDRREYTVRHSGMESTMDDQGSADDHNP